MSPYMTEIVDGGWQDDRTRQLFPHIDADPTTLSPSVDPFTITTSTGFMPLRTPIVDLPAAFRPLQKLAEDLPVVKADGLPGYLASYQFGSVIENSALPDLTDTIDGLTAADGRPDLETVTAVFREYAFLASAYLLEPCWERYDKGLEGYGLGRQTLPRCIAGPLTKTAKMYDHPRHHSRNRVTDHKVGSISTPSCPTPPPTASTIIALTIQPSVLHSTATFASSEHSKKASMQALRKPASCLHM